MKGAEILDKLLVGAQGSTWGLRKLNWALHRIIPFNKPHAIMITEVSDDHIATQLPYRKKNLNHLKGIHACAMATQAEYTSGIFLLQKAKSTGFRLIMKSIHVEYHYQARTAVSASFGMSPADFQSKVLDVLKREGVLLDIFKVELYDTEKNHLATASMEWQLKEWGKTSAGAGA